MNREAAGRWMRPEVIPRSYRGHTEVITGFPGMHGTGMRPWMRPWKCNGYGCSLGAAIAQPGGRASLREGLQSDGPVAQPHREQHAVEPRRDDLVDIPKTRCALFLRAALAIKRGAYLRLLPRVWRPKRFRPLLVPAQRVPLALSLRTRRPKRKALCQVMACYPKPPRLMLH